MRAPKLLTPGVNKPGVRSITQDRSFRAALTRTKTNLLNLPFKRHECCEPRLTLLEDRNGLLSKQLLISPLRGRQGSNGRQLLNTSQLEKTASSTETMQNHKLKSKRGTKQRKWCK